MPLADREDLIAFRRKMDAEGAAAFAAGPWGSWAEGETLLAFATAGKINYTQASNDQQTGQPGLQEISPMRTKHRTVERVATALIALSLVALLVGTAGVYLTKTPDYRVASTRTSPVQLPKRSVDTGGTPAPADGPFTGTLAGLSPIAGGTTAGNYPDTAGIFTTPVIDATPSTLAAGKSLAPTAPTITAGAKPGHNGTRTLTLPPPRAASKQAASAAMVTQSSPAADSGRGDQSTAAQEPLPPAVAINPGTLPAPAAGAKSGRTNTGIVLRHQNKTSPIIPTSATVTLPKQDNGPPAQADTQADLKAPAKKKAAKNKPAQPRPGRWSVVLGSYSSKKIANRMLGKFKGKGIAAELQTVRVEGNTMHRVRVPGYRTKVAALSGADDLNKQSGIDGAWITKR